MTQSNRGLNQEPKPNGNVAHITVSKAADSPLQASRSCREVASLASTSSFMVSIVALVCLFCVRWKL